MSASKPPEMLARSRRYWGFDENMVFVGAPHLSPEEVKELLDKSEYPESEDEGFNDDNSEDEHSEDEDSEDEDLEEDYEDENSDKSEL